MKDGFTKKDFETIRAGKKASDRIALVRTLRTDSDTRFGIVVTKKIGNSVQRHSLQRKIREILRSKDLEEGTMVLVRVFDGDADFKTLDRSISKSLSLIKKREK